jgi:hypothetical protein
MTKKKKSQLTAHEACYAMHCALRKVCDSPLTSALYNLVHLCESPVDSIQSPWEFFGEKVAVCMNEGLDPVEAVEKCIGAKGSSWDRLGSTYLDYLRAAREKGPMRLNEDAEGKLRQWGYAFESMLRCLSKDEIGRMAAYLAER